MVVTRTRGDCGDNSNEEARLKLKTFNEGEFGLPGGFGSSYGP